MARPRKVEIPEDDGDFEDEGTSVAPVAVEATPQVSYKIERAGGLSEPLVKKLPEVRGGICEACGVIDPRKPAHMQYTLCQHYRGMQLQCSYCDRSVDPNEVIASRKLIVREHPDKPGTLVVCCSTTACTTKHRKRFIVSSE